MRVKICERAAVKGGQLWPAAHASLSRPERDECEGRRRRTSKHMALFHLSGLDDREGTHMSLVCLQAI